MCDASQFYSIFAYSKVENKDLLFKETHKIIQFIKNNSIVHLTANEF